MKKILLLIALLSFGLFAMSQETVTTGTTTSIETTSGVFNASASGLDAAKKYKVAFFYDINSGIDGSETSVSSSSQTGSTTFSFSANVSGLSDNIKYYYNAALYEIVGFSSTYVTSGTEKNFKTMPGTPTADDPTNLTNTSLRANWIVGDGGSNGITYLLTVSENSDLSSPVTGYDDLDVGAVTNKVVTGLTQKKTYYYGVKAVNDGGDDAPDNITPMSNIATTEFGLPVELISFTAQVEKENIVLKWTTASEINNDYFDVERSLNNEDFEAIAKVVGSGNSNTIVEYNAIDNKVVNGTVYYRLKQVDYDGAYEYSNTIAVSRDGDKISLEDYKYDGYTISFNYLNPKNESTVITLIDNMGKIIESIELSNSSSRIIFNKNNLKSGLYIINIVTNNDVLIKKIIL